MVINGKYINLRLVTVSDAAFIVKLRNHPERSRYLNNVPNDKVLQENWLKSYKKREQAGSDFYFIIEDKNKTPCGTIRLTRISGESFTWGSWIIAPEAPKKSAIDSLVNLYEYAFKLGYKYSDFFVKKNNLHAIAFYNRFGAHQTHYDHENVYYIFNRNHFNMYRHAYAEFLENT